MRDLSFPHLRWAPLVALALVLVSTIAGPAANQARADVVFLGLGDSLTFGYDPGYAPSFVPSYADQGWVGLVADALKTQNSGVRPTVLNLAIAGELSTSFFTSEQPPGFTARAWNLNLNYPNANTPQFNAMADSIAAIHAAGNKVGYVSFLIGSNDFFYLLATPNYQNATPDQQQLLIVNTLKSVANQYSTLLNSLKLIAPEARLFLPGYYNPIPAGQPLQPIYQLAVDNFNAIAQNSAVTFGGTYVDLATPFIGKELLYTNIGVGDTHPNQTGYQVIADAFVGRVGPTAVPEPGSIALFVVGGIGLLGASLRRRRLLKQAA